MKPRTASPIPDVASSRRAIATVLGAVCVAVITSSCTGLGPSESPPRRTVSLQWRETFRTTESHSLPIGGLPGRTIGVTEHRGLAFFEREEVATLAFWTTSETTGTNITYRGYAHYTFKDGSAIVALVEGIGVVPGKQNGTLTFLQGSGRFLGIEGKATFTAVAVTPSPEGGDTYIDAVGKYSLLQTIPPPPG